MDITKIRFYIILFLSVLIFKCTGKQSLNVNEGLSYKPSDRQTHPQETEFPRSSGFRQLQPDGFQSREFQPFSSSICAFCRSIGHIPCIIQYCLSPPPIPPMSERIIETFSSSMCAYCRAINHTPCINQYCLSPTPLPPMFERLDDLAGSQISTGADDFRSESICARCSSAYKNPDLVPFCRDNGYPNKCFRSIGQSDMCAWCHRVQNFACIEFCFGISAYVEPNSPLYSRPVAIPYFDYSVGSTSRYLSSMCALCHKWNDLNCIRMWCLASPYGPFSGRSYKTIPPTSGLNVEFDIYQSGVQPSFSMHGFSEIGLTTNRNKIQRKQSIRRYKY